MADRTEANNLYRLLLNERSRQALLDTIRNTKFNFMESDADHGVWGKNMNRESENG